jgi:hypothetical protein
MTARSDSDFDPRFDPAFQRGFESASGASTGASTGRRAAHGDNRTVPTRVAEARPVEARSGGYAPTPPIGPPPTVETAAAARVDSELTDAAAEDEQTPRPNPFLIALGAIAVVLVAAGVWGIQAAREPFLGTDVASNVDYVGLQILQLIAPVAVALGVATGIGILFVFAVGWQKRR